MRGILELSTVAALLAAALLTAAKPVPANAAKSVNPRSWQGAPLYTHPDPHPPTHQHSHSHTHISYVTYAPTYTYMHTRNALACIC